MTTVAYKSVTKPGDEALHLRAGTPNECSVAKSRPTLTQHYHALKGAVRSLWWPIPKHHPLHKSLELNANGQVQAIGVGGEDIALQLGKDLGIDIQIIVDASSMRTGRFISHGLDGFEIVGDGTYGEHFRYAAREEVYLCHRLGRDLVKANLGGLIVKFLANGDLTFPGEINKRHSVFSEWSESLPDGSKLLSDGEGVLLCISMLGSREFGYDKIEKRWQELYIAQPYWAFGEILNAETTVSSDVLGLITVFASGVVQLWDTFTFDRFAEINEVLASEDGTCELRVVRTLNSDTTYLYEGDAKGPTGVLQFMPDYFVGKDLEETLYAAWLYAASKSLPTGHGGTSPLGTLFLLFVLILLALTLFSPLASLVLCSFALGAFIWRWAIRFYLEVRLIHDFS